MNDQSFYLDPFSNLQAAPRTNWRTGWENKTNSNAEVRFVYKEGKRCQRRKDWKIRLEEDGVETILGFHHTFYIAYLCFATYIKKLTIEWSL